MHKSIFDSFIKKFGENSFNEIKSTINSEISNYNSTNKLQADYNYLLYIFETAFFKYCGIPIEKIPFVIKQMGNNYIPAVPFDTLIALHNRSIKLIIKYLENNITM